MGQTEKNSVQPLVKPPFSVYAPWLRSLQLRNASAGRAYSVVCTENFIRVDDAPDLIRQMSTENLLWGAPRIHGELLKLGFELAQSSVARHMLKHQGPPNQKWRTFLRNHAPDIAAMDLFVVPTIGFRTLYG